MDACGGTSCSPSPAGQKRGCLPCQSPRPDWITPSCNTSYSPLGDGPNTSRSAALLFLSMSSVVLLYTCFLIKVDEESAELPAECEENAQSQTNTLTKVNTESVYLARNQADFGVGSVVFNPSVLTPISVVLWCSGLHVRRETAVRESSVRVRTGSIFFIKTFIFIFRLWVCLKVLLMLYWCNTCRRRSFISFPLLFKVSLTITSG